MADHENYERYEDDEGGAPLVERILMEMDLLLRNVTILEKLGTERPMGILKLSDAMKLPNHKVRYSLHLLEREGVIEPSAEGAVLTEKAKDYWKTLDKSLDLLSENVRHLKRSVNASRKGGARGKR
jgi:predicted transcriptional regulator